MKILKISFFTLLVFTFLASCQKEFSMEVENASLSTGTWEFQEGATQYGGKVYSSIIENTGGTKTLTISGKSLTGSENFLITLYSAENFTEGTYSTSASETEFIYSASAQTIFNGNLSMGEFTVNITSLSNNSISGTFSGQVIDSTGNPKQITIGKFESSIDLSNNGDIAAVGTLGISAGTCTPVTIAGTYTQGIALSTSNTVQVQVNITSPGTFIIATNTVNGVSFFKDGTFTTTGVQSVILEGSGTPINAGLQNFSVTFGTNNCAFSITFLPGTAVTDYFPTTVNSSWAYGLLGGTSADSSLLKVVSYAPTIAGNAYSTFVADDIPPSGYPDTFYFRKSGGDYFEYLDAADYLPFDESVPGEYIFLKDNVAEGTTFSSPDFTGTYDGIPTTGYIQVTIIAKGVPVTIGTQDFSDVIKVTYDYFSSAFPDFPVNTIERWYARGVGLIHEENFLGTIEIGRYN